jgi:PAS domain S-box-containing protein
LPDSPNLLDEDQFQTLLEVSPDALVLVDADGVIVRINHQTELLFGYAREELLGQPVELLLPERFGGRHRHHRAGFHARPRIRAMGEGLELFGRRGDGSEFPLDISLGPVETGGGVLVVAAVRDATERKRAEEVSRQLAANQLRRRQALELNDGVVQGLTAVALALDLGELEKAEELLTSTLVSARRLVSHLLGELDDEPGLQAGDLVRSEPAIIPPEKR